MCTWMPTSSTCGLAAARASAASARRRVPGDAEAELRVDLAGADELVGVGLDARRDAQQHRRPSRPPRGHERLEAVELVVAVDDDAADARRRRRAAQLVLGLVVAVQDEPVGGHPGGEGDVELAAGGHVEVQPLLVGEAGHRPAEERLRGVGGAVGERVDGLPAPGPQVRLVVDEQRRAELGRRARAVEQPPIASQPSSPTAAVSGSRCRGQRAGHCTAQSIRSGADTPSRSRPIAQADARRLDQPQPRLGELGRDARRHHVAVVVEAVDRAGELAHPRRDPVRRPVGDGERRPRRAARDSDRSTSSSRSWMSSAEVDVGERPALDARLGRPPVDAGDPGVGHLHVEDRVVHRLLRRARRGRRSGGESIDWSR